MALLGCWIAGSFLGLLAARFVPEIRPDGVRMIACGELTPGGMFVTALFPLCCSACAVMIFRSRACFWCGLLHGAGLGFGIGAVCAAWPTGALLMTFLLLFSRLWTNPVLLLYWLRRLEHGERFFLRDTVCCFGCCLGIGILDYGIIAPFLADAIY